MTNLKIIRAIEKADLFPDKTLYEYIEFKVNTIRNNEFKGMYCDDEIDILYNMLEKIKMERRVYILLENLLKYDYYTYIHSINVFIYSVLFAIKYTKNTDFLYDISIASLLHDIGKMKIPIEILNKTEALTNEEMNIIKRHTLMAKDVMQENGIFFPKRIMNGIVGHHEKINSTGYPYGLEGDSITTLTQIITLADIFDALNSDRVYRKKLSKKYCYDFIVKSEQSIFRKEVIDLFNNAFVLYSPGENIKLNNDMYGIIASPNKVNQKYPYIYILRSPSYLEINLEEHKELID